MLFSHKKIKQQDVKKTDIEEKKQKSEPKPQKQEKKIGSLAQPTAFSVLVRPVITEKATYMQTQNVYAFEIYPNANKISVKKAIKEVYKVEPIKVNIIKVKGKRVRYGKSVGKTKDWKKALIFLKKGDKIEFVNK